MVRVKKQKRIIFFFILAVLFLFPVLYMLVSSVWTGIQSGLSLMNYYKVFLESPGYLVKFWRSFGMCILIAGGQTIFSCKMCIRDRYGRRTNQETGRRFLSCKWSDRA